jgi:Mrp family chromosome partitioning ATPase
MSTKDKKREMQNKATIEEATEVVAEDINMEAVEDTIMEEITPLEESIESGNGVISEDDKAIVKQSADDIEVAETPVLATATKSEMTKPAGTKLTGAEKAAKKRAAKLAKAKSDMEARLFQLYQQLDVEPAVGNPFVLGVSSSLRGEGRTTTALTMANILASTLPFPVLLLTTDISQPGRFLPEGEEVKNDLCRYLRGETTIEGLAQPTAINDLWIVPVGNSHNQTLKLLRSTRLEEVFEEFKQNFGAIVVDMPPMVLSAEFGRVMGMMDKIIFVVEAGTTPRKMVKSNLEFIHDKLGGLLLNRVKAVGPGFLRKILSF